MQIYSYFQKRLFLFYFSDSSISHKTLTFSTSAIAFRYFISCSKDLNFFVSKKSTMFISLQKYTILSATSFRIPIIHPPDHMWLTINLCFFIKLKRPYMDFLDCYFAKTQKTTKSVMDKAVWRGIIV